MLDEAVVNFWGERLVRWPKDVVAKLPIASSDLEYLTSVGLPGGVDWNLEFSIPTAEASPPLSNGLLELGRDGGVARICLVVDSARMPTGQVIWVDGERVRLVNSDLGNFGAFLVQYEEYRQRVRGLEEEDALRLIADTQVRMQKLDAQCMSDPEMYWPFIVEQMRHGLL